MTVEIQRNLRMSGYSAHLTRIICDGPRDDERTAVLRFDLDEDSSTGRDIVAQLLTVVDSPRALLGRSKNGSAVLLFRCGKHSPAPTISGQSGVFTLALRDSGVRLAITCASDGQSLNVAEYTFAKGRSPFDVGSWELPALTSDMGEAVVDAAFTAGCMWAEQYEAERANEQRYADIRSGKIKIPTEAELEAERDDKLVAHYAGVEFGQFDDLRPVIRAARLRVAERARLKAERAISDTAA